MFKFYLVKNKLFKQKRRFVFLLLVFFIFFVFTITSGCESFDKLKIKQLKNDIVRIFNRGEDINKAVEVVNKFFNAMIEKDYNKAYDCIYNNKNQTIDDFKKEISNVTDIVKIEINWVEVKNNIAVVGIDLIDTYDGEEKIYKDLKVSLIKDNNQEWKINFWK